MSIGSKKREGGFDKTQLSIKDALKTGNINRDYITHCFRWSFAINYGHAKKDKTYLDFGCGQELPFLDTMFSSRRGDKTVAKYVGVDLNEIKVPSHRQGTVKNPKYDVRILDNTNILDVTKEQVGDINTVVSFEVFEHCPPEVVEPILRHLHSLADEDAVFIYSTPCFNGKAAKNHINEMSRECFGFLLESTGHTIVENYGTYASINDYKKQLSEEHLRIFEELHKYHSIEVLANFLAPLYPEYSRNNIWVCRKRKVGDDYRFLNAGPLPRSQNGYWDNV